MTWLYYVKINQTSLQTTYIISKSSVFDHSTHMNSMILIEKMGCCLSIIKKNVFLMSLEYILLLSTNYRQILYRIVRFSLMQFKHVKMAWFESSYVHVSNCAQQIIKDTSTRSVTCDWANESQEEIDAKDKRATISWCLCCQTKTSHAY